MFFQAGILIDDHPVTAPEREVLGRALEVYMLLTTGRLAAAAGYADLAIAKELANDPGRRQRVKGLIQKADSVLWEGRSPWSIFDHVRCPDSAVLAHSLHKRLLRNENEIVRASKHLEMLRVLRKDTDSAWE